MTIMTIHVDADMYDTEGGQETTVSFGVAFAY